jgi:hypothetical protein
MSKKFIRLTEIELVNLINEIVSDTSGFKTERGNIVHISPNNEKSVYSLTASNMIIGNKKLYITKFDINGKTFTYYDNGKETTKDISSEKLKTIIKNIIDGIDSFTIESTLYNINFKKVK